MNEMVDMKLKLKEFSRIVGLCRSSKHFFKER